MAEKPKGWNNGEIRCYDCIYYKKLGRGFSGWCQDAKPKIRVNAVDYCDCAKKKSEG